MHTAMWRYAFHLLPKSLQIFQHYIKPRALSLNTHHYIPMAISKSTLLISYVSLGLLLCHASLAQFTHGNGRSPWEGTRRLAQQSACQIEKLSAQEPKRVVKSEAGRSEFFDEKDEQFDCAGVSAVRRTIQQGALLLPSFSNAPILIYVVQGRGIISIVIPGCPESYRSFRQHSESQKRIKDQHQRIHHIEEGQIIALPAGVVSWCHNSGESPLVTVSVMDTSNSANQLDRLPRQFMLAGSQQQGDQREELHNILSGFDTETLAAVMGISEALAEKLKGRNDQRGEIVRALGMLDMLRQEYSEHEEEEREERENGLEQAVCSMRIREDIGDPRRADIYNPDAGRLTNLNSQKLPILRHLRLSAVRGALRKNAFLAPYWKVNAHGIMYVIRGSCRCQVVDNLGRTVFDGEVREGQMLVVPQNFAQLKQSASDDFEWVTFETNDNSISNPVVGEGSALKGMPEEVLMNSYRISREEARRVKTSRGAEFAIFAPRPQQERANA